MNGLRGSIGLVQGRLGSFRFKLVAWFALLALLPLAVAFYGYDSRAERSESRRADAALEASLRVAVAGYSQRLDAASATAQRLAGELRVQRALHARDRSALAAIAAAAPGVRLSAGAVSVGELPRLAALRTVAVVDRGSRIGAITASVRIDDRLLRGLGVGLAPGGRLAAIRDGRVVAGGSFGSALRLTPGKAAQVRFDGEASR